MSYNLELLTSENQAQWTNVSKITPGIQKKEIKPYVKLALKELEGTPDSRIASLSNFNNYSAVRAVVRHFTRLKSSSKGPWSPADVQTFLESVRFSQECIEELAPLVCAESLYMHVICFSSKPSLVELSWKIDVSISQKLAESSKADPKEIYHKNTYVILIMKLSNGTSKCFRLSLIKFHELRYQVCVVLKNMIILEKRKSMSVNI